ncbi:MAG: arginine decarboxylase, pyruvoyl-dependent [Candidatus Bipolaricaulota bacterium]
MMLSTVVQYAYLASGKAEGTTELNAFDGALLAAGIGDLNLIRVTSIMPRRVSLLEKVPTLEQGDFVLAVYGARTSTVPGKMIASAVGVGRAEDGFGVVMEAQGASEAEVEADVQAKVEAAFRIRGIRPTEVRVAAVEHQVERCGGVVAACLFF